MSSPPPIRIHILRCGYMCVSRDTVKVEKKNYYLPSSRAHTPMRSRVELPVFCYLIEHPKGSILIDTGWDRSVCPNGVFDRRAAAEALTPTLASYYHPTLPLGASALEQLSALGMKPSDIDYLLLTHLDPDHVSALGSLRDAKHIICSQEDYWWSCRTVWRVRQPQKLWLSDRLETFWFKGSDYGATFWSKDFFDDGSVRLVHLPGHTDGMYGVVVYNGPRYVLLASDAVYDSSMSLPGFGFNPDAQRRSIAWLDKMRRDPNCVALLPSHDPSVTSGVIEL